MEISHWLVIVSLVINVSIAIILMLVKMGINEMKEDINRAEEKGNEALRGVTIARDEIGEVRNDLEKTKVNYIERFSEIKDTIRQTERNIMKHIDKKMSLR